MIRNNWDSYWYEMNIFVSWVFELVFEFVVDNDVVYFGNGFWCLVIDGIGWFVGGDLVDLLGIISGFGEVMFFGKKYFRYVYWWYWFIWIIM